MGSGADIFRTNTFCVFGKYVWSPYLLIAVPVLVGVLCLPFAVKSWSRRLRVLIENGQKEKFKKKYQKKMLESDSNSVFDIFFSWRNTKQGFYTSLFLRAHWGER